MWPREWWFESLRVERLWKELGRGEGATVAIWDSGLDEKASFIEAKRVSGRSFIPGENPMIYNDTRPGRHGSEIARLIAGSSDRGGIAPACDVKVARAVNEHGWSDFAAFMTDPEFAAVDLVSISHALVPGDLSHDPIITAMRAHIPSDVRLVVAACGNDGRGSEPMEIIPASIPGVVAVGATENAAHAAWRMSTNALNVTLAAPGARITGVYSPVLQGTSFSCALVAGVCALVAGFLKRSGKPHGRGEIAAALLAACSMPSGADPQIVGRGVIDSEKLINHLRS